MCTIQNELATTHFGSIFPGTQVKKNRFTQQSHPNLLFLYLFWKICSYSLFYFILSIRKLLIAILVIVSLVQILFINRIAQSAPFRDIFITVFSCPFGTPPGVCNTFGQIVPTFPGSPDGMVHPGQIGQLGLNNLIAERDVIWVGGSAFPGLTQLPDHFSVTAGRNIQIQGPQNSPISIIPSALNGGPFLNNKGTIILTANESIFGSTIIRGIPSNPSITWDIFASAKSIDLRVGNGIFLNPNSGKINSIRINDRSIEGSINTNIPTVVLIHGWEPGDAPLSDISSAIHQAVSQSNNSLNVVLFNWSGAYTGLCTPSCYNKAAENAFSSGVTLANSLKELFPKDYNKPIHVIAHSLGTVVGAIATQNFSKKIDQFTILDAPSRTPEFPAPTLSFTEEFYNRTLGHHIDYVDNYYSSLPSPLAFGTRISNAAPNGGVLLQGASHSGVHEHYADIIQPGGDPWISAAFDPGGFEVSSRDSRWSPSSFLISNEVLANWNVIEGTADSVIITVNGKEKKGINLRENSPSSVSQRITFDMDDNFLELELVILAGGDGDIFRITIDEQSVFEFDILDNLKNEPFTLNIPIQDWRGRDMLIKLLLESAGSSNASIWIGDLSLVGSIIINTPEPPIWSLIIPYILFFAFVRRIFSGRMKRRRTASCPRSTEAASLLPSSFQC